MVKNSPNVDESGPTLDQDLEFKNGRQNKGNYGNEGQHKEKSYTG
jgi:hypothetical protein